MKLTTRISLAALVLTVFAAPAMAASSDGDREATVFGQMLHKLGRGLINVVTAVVEIPRQVSTEWTRTDPITGLVVGGVKGVAWGFTRFVTGLYETATFPIPVPDNYEVMLEPEFVVTDVWGDPIPGLTEFSSNDPLYPEGEPIYPRRTRY